MPVIKASSLRDLKNRVNIHDVVGRVVTLRSAGSARFKGLCPFHSEKTPSFNVSADKGYYKCFGCGKAGDIINFVMESEGLQFTESVEAIAQRFAFTLEYEEGSGGPTKESRSLRQEIFDIHDLAADYYRQCFLAKTPHGEFIRNYWTQNRRFTPELGEDFKIGFAPPEDSGLAATLLKKEFTEEALRQCGLFFTRDGAVLTIGALRPRFRGRLMIPIRDHQGRVVAFTARQLELTPQDDPAREAKYVNSPETPIFTKSNLLFNLDRARTQAGDGRPFVLVEGQLDALRCWSVGLKTAIAPQGTSITEGQLALLRRYHPQVECFFDSDAAGQKAALRFLPMALKAGLEVKFLMLAGSEKLDPDLLFLEKGIDGYQLVQRDSRTAMQFACRAILPAPEDATPASKVEAFKQIRNIVDQCESQIARQAYYEQCAQLLRIMNIGVLISETKVTNGVATVATASRPRFNIGGVQIKPRAPFESHEKQGIEAHMLFLCLHHNSLLQALAGLLPHEWIDQSQTAGRVLDRILAEVTHNGWNGSEPFEQLLETEEEKALVASLLFETPDEDDLIKVACQGLRSLQRRFLEPRLRQIELEIATKGTDIDFSFLLKQRSDLTRQLLNPPKLTLGA